VDVLKKIIVATFATVLVLSFGACASSQPVSTSNTDELDRAVREASDYLNHNIPHGNKLAILNFQSEYPALSEYVIDELITNAVNDKIFTVVDRANLALIRQETDFQLSGDVSDETAVSIGEKLGAQTIISGSVSQIGNLYRLRVRALDVQTAQIQGQFNRNISDSPTIAILVQSVTIEPESGKTVDNAIIVTNEPAKELSKPVLYKIGDEGPAGGYIFYDKGNNRGGWRYLEAAPEDTERTLPFGERVRGDGPFGRKAGDGMENTKSLIAYIQMNGGGINTAVWYCDELVVNGYDDWYLPTTDELMYIYNNLFLKDIGGCKRAKYWSSLCPYSEAREIDFSDGRENKAFFTKEHKLQVRAVRRF
jgi:TolB-like protein